MHRHSTTTTSTIILAVRRVFHPPCDDSAHPHSSYPPKNRFDLYLEVRLWQKAAETAFRLKDPGRLRQVQGSCGGMPGLTRAIEEMLLKI